MIILLKFLIINGLMTVINFLIYILLIEYVKFGYIFSNMLSYIFIIIISYFFNEIFVFKTKICYYKFFKFIIMKMGMGILGSIILYYIVEKMKFGEYIGNILTIIICFFISYLLSCLIFKRKETRE